MLELLGALLLGEDVEEFTDLAPRFLDVTGLDELASCFNFAKTCFDRLRTGL